MSNAPVMSSHDASQLTVELGDINGWHVVREESKGRVRYLDKGGLWARRIADARIMSYREAVQQAEFFGDEVAPWGFRRAVLSASDYPLPANEPVADVI